MILEFLLIIGSFIGAFASFVSIITDPHTTNEINWKMIAAFIFFTTLFIFLVKPHREETPEQIKSKWKFKNYEEVHDYLEKQHNHLKYEKDVKESLVILLFFDWVIIDDSNPEALVLKRKTSTSNETQIFKPTNKKSL